ncbi:MAG: plastocyanin/azurin family copper-binding protein [Actinomycetota bacterium]
MKRLMVAASVLMVALASVPAGAATKEVQITNSSFDPKAVKVAVGSSVHWTKGTTRDPHNVRENGGIFTSGSQTSEAIDFTATFSAGKFGYHCVVHQSFGMTGVVKVPVSIQAKPAGRPFTVKWATAATDTGTTYDVQFKIGTGAWTDWLAKTDSRSAVFGQGGEPIRVRADKTYSFRVRSRLVDIKSGWSPKRSFKT